MARALHGLVAFGADVDWMNRRRLLLMISTIAIVSCGLGFSLLLTPTRRLKVENYESIRIGMTLAEVEDLLGGPAGNFGRYRGGGFESLEGAPGTRNRREWFDDSNKFEVSFDEKDRVVYKHKRASYGQHPESWADWFRRVTGIRWR